MFKKLALVFTVISILLVSSVTCFAAVDRYSVEILGFDVHNADNNTWYGLMRTQNQADVLTFSAGTTQNWFGTVDALFKSVENVGRAYIYTRSDEVSTTSTSLITYVDVSGIEGHIRLQYSASTGLFKYIKVNIYIDGKEE
jgi:hypothetical protein